MELLERFTRGEMDAFEALFRLFQGEVYGWIVRIVREPSAAEDLTVEAFWRMYRAHARFDPRRRSRSGRFATRERLRREHFQSGAPRKGSARFRPENPAQQGGRAGGAQRNSEGEGSNSKLEISDLKSQTEATETADPSPPSAKSAAGFEMTGSSSARREGHAAVDPQGCFGAWARRIATNLALDHLKRMRRELPLVVDPADEPRANPGVRREMREQITRAFEELSPRLRAVSALALVEEVPYEEIAEALGISVTTVRVRVFRATRILREQLRAVGGHPQKLTRSGI